MRRPLLFVFSAVVAVFAILALIVISSLRESGDSSVSAVDSGASAPRAEFPGGALSVEAAAHAQEDFLEWLSAYRASGGSVNDSEMKLGIAVAEARREQMRRLIQSDPEAALSWTLGLDDYVALPSAVAAYVEKPMSGLGDLDLRWSTKLDADGRIQCSHHNQLFLKGESYRAYSAELQDAKEPVFGTPVFAYVLDGLALMGSSPVYAVAPEEFAAAAALFESKTEGGDPLRVDAGETDHPAVIAGGVYAFETPGSLAHVEAGIIAAEQAARETRQYAVDLPFAWLAGDTGSYQPGITQSSFFANDNIDVLFIRCDFSDFPGEPVSKADLESDLAAVSGHLNTMSYGTASVTATVTTTLYRPGSTGTSYAQAGDDDGLYNDVVAAYDASPDALASSSYDVVAIFFPNLGGVTNSEITYGGLASVGGTRHWINGVSFSTGRINVIGHEFGHNYGLFHANYWHPEQALGGTYYGSPAYSLEYGDIFDLMGNGDVPEAHFNPYQKHRIEWLPENNVATATGDATYRIYRFDHIDATDNPLLALRVPVGGDVVWWVGHRQLFDSNPNMENGAYVVAEGLYANRPNLIDLTPESEPNESSDRFDAALPVGESYEDALAGVTLTTVASGTNGSGDEWIDVSVDFEAQMGFTDAFFEFEEAAGIAYLTLSRGFDTAGAVSVDYTTSNQTATAGVDYYAASGTVSWADGDSADKTIAIHLRPDAVAEDGEYFTVTLSNPTNGVVESGRGSADVYILDPGERYQSFDPDFFNVVVNAIGFQSDGRAIIAGDIYAGSGDFAGAGNIARLELDGSVDPLFNDGGSGFNGDVEKLLVLGDDRIVAAGSFTTYNGVSVPGLVCLEADGTLDTSFDTNLGTGPNAAVNALAVESDGRILVGGSFTSFNGATVEGLLRLNADGSAATALSLPFNTGFSTNVRDIEVLEDGDILVTGSFYIGWTGSGFRSGVARLNADGSRDSSFDPDAGLHGLGNVGSLSSGLQVATHPDGDVLIGGFFDAYDENAADYFVRVNAGGSFDRVSPVTFDNYVSVITVEPFGGVFVGKWSGAGSELVRLAEDWTLDSDFTWLGGASGSVYAIERASDGSLYVGGNFFNYNGSGSRPVVRIASGISPYDSWAASYFTGAERAAGTADPTADADGDEIPNLAEMALGTDPTVANSSSDFGSGYLDGLSLAEDGNDRYLQLTLNKSALQGGVWYGVQVSTDLINWSPDPVIPGDDTAFEIIEDSQNWLIIRDRTPITPGSPRFVRLALQSPE